MNEKCIVCGREAEFPFHVLEVKTLHLREMDGEKRIQALGGWQDYAVCRACAEKREETDRDYLKAAAPKLRRFGLVGIAGLALLVISLVFLHGDRIYVVLSLMALACCGLGFYGTLQETRERQNHLSALRPEDAVYDSAWEVLTDHAPKKAQDSDLTYIPLNSRTLGMKKGDLMVAWDLLPEIAVLAHDRIHQEHTARKQNQLT